LRSARTNKSAKDTSPELLYEGSSYEAGRRLGSRLKRADVFRGAGLGRSFGCVWRKRPRQTSLRMTNRRGARKRLGQTSLRMTNRRGAQETAPNFAQDDRFKTGPKDWANSAEDQRLVGRRRKRPMWITTQDYDLGSSSPGACFCIVVETGQMPGVGMRRYDE
jgi:hypothetical protein